MKRIVTTIALFSLLIFSLSADFKLITEKNSMPKWVEAAIFNKTEEIRTSLKIPDSESVCIFFIKTTNENSVERQAEFDFIYSLQSMFSLVFKTNSFGEKTILVSLEPVSIETSKHFETEKKTFSQVLHTPSADFTVIDSNGNFVLNKHGLLWLKLAFYENHPKLAESVRKVSEYKSESSLEQDNYSYVAVYAYDKGLFEEELNKYKN